MAAWPHGRRLTGKAYEACRQGGREGTLTRARNSTRCLPLLHSRSSPLYWTHCSSRLGVKARTHIDSHFHSRSRLVAWGFSNLPPRRPLNRQRVVAVHLNIGHLDRRPALPQEPQPRILCHEPPSRLRLLRSASQVADTIELRHHPPLVLCHC